MGALLHPAESGEIDDPAYPRSLPGDAALPAQTLEPLDGVLDGIAMPSVWSRLGAPLGAALDDLWSEIGLFARGRPSCWISIHFGRIAVNAHGWERLRCAATGSAPDRELVPPPPARWGGLLVWLERMRVALRAGALVERVAAAERAGREALEKAGRRDADELDAAELARGPLHEGEWLELLLPWLAARIAGDAGDDFAARIESAIHLEQRFSSHLGRRLVNDGVLHKPADVAYLTVEERIRAVHEPDAFWLKLARARARKVASFADVEIPSRFWGRPRVEFVKDPLP